MKSRIGELEAAPQRLMDDRICHDKNSAERFIAPLTRLTRQVYCNTEERLVGYDPVYLCLFINCLISPGNLRRGTLSLA